MDERNGISWSMGLFVSMKQNPKTQEPLMINFNMKIYRDHSDLIYRMNKSPRPMPQLCFDRCVVASGSEILHFSAFALFCCPSWISLWIQINIISWVSFSFNFWCLMSSLIGWAQTGWFVFLSNYIKVSFTRVFLWITFRILNFLLRNFFI